MLLVAAAEYLCEPIMQCQREWMRSTLNELTCVILFNLFWRFLFFCISPFFRMHQIYSIRVHMCIKIINISERLAWRLPIDLVLFYQVPHLTWGYWLFFYIFFQSLLQPKEVGRKEEEENFSQLCNAQVRK